MKTCFNVRQQRLLKDCFIILPCYLMAMVVLGLVTGCVTVEDRDPDIIVIDDPDGCDAGVPDTDAAPEPDAEPDPVLLNLVFGGPPSGTVIDIGAQNEDVLCFAATATEEMEIQRFRIRLSSQHGFLLYDSVPRFGDLKIVDNGSGIVVAGPVELDTSGNTWSQTRVMNDIMPMTAGQIRSLCIRMDVSSDLGLQNEHIAVALLPFEQGDVVLTDENVELPIAQIDIGTGLSTELVLEAPP